MYRGKRKDTGEWVYGWYVKDWDGRSYIITKFGPYITGCSDCGAHDQDIYEVDPETVGQSSGRRDRNGTEIYEGDIVRQNDAGDIFDHEMKWDEEDAGFVFECTGERWRAPDMSLEWCEVIGNRFDHPHLLKGEGQ